MIQNATTVECDCFMNNAPCITEGQITWSAPFFQLCFIISYLIREIIMGNWLLWNSYHSEKFELPRARSTCSCLLGSAVICRLSLRLIMYVTLEIHVIWDMILVVSLQFGTMSDISMSIMLLVEMRSSQEVFEFKTTRHSNLHPLLE